MTSCMDFMIFDVYFGFCDLSASKIGKKRFYTFSNSPAYAELKKSDIFTLG